MLVKKNIGKFTGSLLISAILIIFPALRLSAAGIAIIKNHNQTELIISSAYKDAFGIELELSGEGILSIEKGSEKDLLRFSAGDKAEKIYLYQSLSGFFPDKIIIKGNSGWDLVSAGLVFNNEKNSFQPADIGHIIFSDFKVNNSPLWQVYSWNLVPEVLIYDTSNYSVQSRIFKRLAFFVEKPGYVGRIVTNEELDGKHGWNAHDYKAEDLADFFNRVEETGFTLNNEELSLREQLLEHGIIRTSDRGEAFTAGRGAVLSVSRETETSWRYRFLTHECLHGLFFTDSSYKSEIYEAFEELQPEEIEFWKHLLDYRRYDINNSYLLVNEFMAYSLQQPAIEVDEYFKGFLYVRMTAARPWESSFIADFDKNFPDSFKSSVLKLEKVLYNHTGRIAGHLANIYPVEVKDSFFNLFPPM